MDALDRRHFLFTTATAASVSAAAGAGTVAVPVSRQEWERLVGDREFSTYDSALQTDDGYVLVGALRDGEYATEGAAVHLTRSGDLRWEDRYRSTPQREVRDREVQTGPIPEDWLSFALEADDGFLFVGWTYFDGAAVNVARLFRVDRTGTVRRETSLGDLEGASAYSVLTDGVATEDGFLLCGIESPGIMLGGGGWLVSVADDGTVNWHERYPATDRDLERTTRRDEFNAITPTDDGFVAVGSYEPDDDGRSRAWLVGLDEDGGVRWDDRFDLGVEGSTVAYDVERSAVDGYDLLVVGAAGEQIARTGRSLLTSPGVSGDGFVAAYTDDGERQWLQTLEETPLFCTGDGPEGIVAGGARDGHGWVGTVDRTEFEADEESVVTSLCPAHDGAFVAAGRRVDADRSEAWARSIDVTGRDDGDRDDDASDREAEGDGRDEDADDGGETDDGGEADDGRKSDDGGEADDGGDDPTDEAVEFLDCTRARVTGDYADVILGISFDPGDGLLGTIREPVGGVDGERTIDSVEEFDLPADDTVLESVELFEDESTATPGLGVLTVYNPTYEECWEDRLGHLDDGRRADEGGTADANDGETADANEDEQAERSETDDSDGANGDVSEGPDGD